MAPCRTEVARRGLLATAMVALAAAAPPAVTSPPKPPSSRLPPLPPAMIDDTLAIGGKEIAAKRVSTRMSVAVRVDGWGPFAFVVDSGADTSALSTRIVRELGLPAGTTVTMHSMTGTGPVVRAQVGELALGESIVRALELPVLEADDLGAAGLVGIDALVEQRLMMDFEKRSVTIEDAHRPTRRMDGEIVVTARRRRGQLILTQAAVDGRGVEAVIDTGSEITIGNSVLRALLERHRRTRVETIDVVGVNGVTVTMQLIRLAEIRVGPVVVRDVPIAFFDVPPFAAFGLDDRPAILLGTDLMANFRRVSLDFRARKVRFQLRKCTGTFVTVSTSAIPSRISATDPGLPSCGG